MKSTFRILNAVIVLTLVLGLLTPLQAWGGAIASVASTFTVNSRYDPGDGTCDATECTLREAITAANNHSGNDTIVFDIPYLDLPFPTIVPLSPLPAITGPVIIDGSDQGPLGYAFLYGVNAGASAYGLRITAGSSTVKMVEIYGFDGPGISLESNGNNLIEDNVIFENGGAGIVVLSGAGNRIRSNSLSDNSGLGIDLGNSDGVTPNDDGDGDSGPNNLQNYPSVTQVTGGNIQGNLQSTPNGQFQIEFFSNRFCDPLRYGEGATSLGSVSVTTDGQGAAQFNFTYAGEEQVRNVTTTATDANGSTSEFSSCVADLIVNSTNDGIDQVQGDGECDTGNVTAQGEPECTLRAAIQESSATAGKERIIFDIPTSSSAAPVIQPGSALPQVWQAVEMDATTQPRSHKVMVDGTNAGGSANGLTIFAGGSTVKGLIIARFGGDGIRVSTNGNNTISDNIIGGNQNGIYLDNVSSNVIQSNSITTNLQSGIVIASASAQSNLVRDNVVTANRVNLTVSGQSNQIYNNVFKMSPATQQNASFTPGLGNTLNTAKTAGRNIIGEAFLGGNYWSDYTGSDADGDKLGDTPFTFNASNVDNLPLVGRPELAVQPITLNAGEVFFRAADNKYILPARVVVGNVGTATAANVLVRFSDNGGMNTTQTIPQLAVDASTQLNLDWDITDILRPGNGRGIVELEVVADANNAIAELDEANNTRQGAAQVDVRPRIIQVEPDYYPGWFMAGVNVWNKFEATIDWNGDLAGMDLEQGQTVFFELSGVQVTEPVNGQDKVSHTFNMGSDLYEGRNYMHIYARDGAGFDSDEVIIEMHQTAVPQWLYFIPGHQSTFEIERVYRSGPDLVIYRSNFKFPGEVIKAAAAATSQAGPAEGRFGPSIPAWELRLEDHSNGRGRVSGIAGITAEAKSKNYEGSFGGGVEAMTRVDEQDKIRLMELWAIIRGSGKLKSPKWRLPQAPVVYVQLTGGLDAEARLGAEENRATQELEFKQDVILRLEPAFEAAVVAGEKGLAWAEVAFGGKGRGEFQFFSSPYVRSALIRTYLRLAAGVLWFEKVQTWTWTWVLVGAQGQDAEVYLVGRPEPAGAAEWHSIPRNYASPAAFARTPLAANGLSADLVETYPYADPAAAYLGNGQTLAAWVHDDPGKLQHQGLEIYSALWNGLNWSAPLSLTNDLVMDMQPALAATPDGALAVWTRLHDVITGTAPVSPTQVYNQIEIAYSTYNTAGNTWSAPQLLTNNSVMDFLPSARSHFSQTMLIWLQDPDNDLPTFPTDTTLLDEDPYYAVRDGTSWIISPTQALADVATAEQPQFTYNGQQAVLVWSQDADANPTTVTDTEILYATWNVTTTNWSAPQPLTNNTLTDLSPRLAYDGDGAVHLLWVQEIPNPDNPSDASGQLYHATFNGSAWSAPSLVLEAPGIEGLQLVSDEHDNLVALWRSASNELSDLYSSVYDKQHGSWSQPAFLTQDRDVEWAYDAVYDDLNDQIFLALIKRQALTETVPVEFPASVLQSGMINVAGVAQITETDYITLPTFGPSNLAQLVYVPAPDLAITSTDIALLPANPLPGGMALISATVHNVGDLAADPVRVAFYDGDPSAGGSLIGAVQSLTSSLAGGLTATVAVSWTVPITPAVHSLYVKVDPSDEVAEGDEGNNLAAQSAVLPDLVVRYAYADYSSTQSITLTALISNTGGYTATDVQVEFRQEAVTGTLLGQSPPVTLGAGQAQVFTLTWDISATLPATHTIWVLADPAGVITEADKENNIGILWADILPDLTLSSTDIWGNAPVSITVHNNGLVTATDVTVALYRDGITGTLLYSGAIASIPPGGTGALSASTAAGHYDVFVHVDPADAIAEMDESNNLASTALLVWREVYLPLVLR